MNEDLPQAPDGRMARLHQGLKRWRVQFVTWLSTAFGPPPSTGWTP